MRDLQPADDAWRGRLYLLLVLAAEHGVHGLQSLPPADLFSLLSDAGASAPLSTVR